MDWIANYGLFLLETVTVVIAVVVIIAAIGSVATKHKTTGKEGVEIIRLNNIKKEASNNKTQQQKIQNINA